VIHKLSDFNMYVAIAGFRNAKIDDIDRFFDDVKKELTNVPAVQFFDAKLVATWQHLYFAALNALTVFSNNTNISNSLAIETLLYASAQRQIRKAAETIGVKSTTSDVAVLVIAENENSVNNALKTIQKLIFGKRDDSVTEINQEKFDTIKRFFGISDVELTATLKRKGLEKEALVDLVIEHCALLATRR